MWYVMQVTSGKEDQTILIMERRLSNKILKNCFIPMRRLKKKYHGKWQEITEKLFPGYVFLVSSQPQLLYDELKGIPALTKLLGSCEEYFTPLSQEDVCFLRKLQNVQSILPVKQNVKDAQHRLPDARYEGDRLEAELWMCQRQEAGITQVGVSQVIVGGNRQIQIISGPLKNLEGQIRKINLHKRIAVVETEFMGSKSLIHLGIEIVNEGLKNEA